jgi:hypothetical protein
VSGLGERGTALRAVARKLDPPPEVPPFYVESPDEIELRARGWYMRMSRTEEPIFLGHSVTAAIVWLRTEWPKGVRKKGRKRTKA